MSLWSRQMRFLKTYWTLFSPYIPTEESFKLTALSKNSGVLHPHPPWTADSSPLLNLQNSPPFFISDPTPDCSLLVCSCLFYFTAGKILGRGRERGAWHLSPVPFLSSCCSLSLDYPIFKNYNVLSNTQALNLGTTFDFWLPPQPHSI